MNLNLRFALILGLVALLAGCGDPPPSPTLELQHPDTLKLETGKTQQLQYKATNLSNPAVEWISSNPQVASVNASGQVQGKTQGSAIISVVSKENSGLKDSLVLEVVPPIVVQVNPSAPQNLGLGNTLQLSSTVTGSSNTAVRWESDQPSIAEVSTSGLVISKAVGLAKISAISLADESKRASVNVTVIDGIVVTLNPNTNQTRQIGQTLQLSATLSNTSNQNVNWSSSNTAVATINSSGLATALASGQTTLTATSQADPSRSSSLILTIETVTVSLTPSSNQTLGEGETRQLSASVSGHSNINVTWSSSNTAVATVNSSGLVSAQAPGQATITATSQADPSKSASLQVQVNGIQVSLNPSTNQTLQVDDTLTVQSTVSGTSNTAVTWDSNNTTVATVNSSGLVTAKANGTAKITATSQANPNKKASIDVTVVPKISVSLSPSGTISLQNKPKQLTATVSNSSNQNVNWNSSNTGIATVNSSGLVSAVNTGSATITATSQADPRRTAQVTINVLAPVKILLLGDSITQGLDSNVIGTHLFGYRRYLYEKLNNAGYRFDFVGSMNKVYSGTATCVPSTSYPVPDVENDGHAGWRTNEILGGYPGANVCTGSGKLSDWIQNYSADLVIIHLGTNDINTSANRLRTAELAANDTGSIIDTIRVRFPNIKILLSKIIANSPGDNTIDSRITDLNNRLTTLASTKNQANSPITLVDQYTHFKATFSGSTSTYLLSDGVHPNTTGENAMAQKYYDSLVGILPTP